MRCFLPIAVLFCFVVHLYAQPGDEPAVRIIRGGLINNLRGGDQFAITELSPTVYVDEVAGDVRGQIDRVSQLVKSEQWDEAVDMLTRLSEYTDRKLTNSTEPHKEGFDRYVSVAQFVTERISFIGSRSPTALARYRERINPLAEQWFEQGIANRDTRLLKKVVRDSFHSSVGDDALLVLGDIALEAGNHGIARRYWSRIHPSFQWDNNKRKSPFWQRMIQGEVISSIVKDLADGGDRIEPVTSQKDSAPKGLTAYVETDIPLADVWARLVLTSILEGNNERSKLELSILRKLWPDASGMLGGREANYRKTLSKLINESESWKELKPDTDWPTFAGSVDRNHQTATDIDIPTKPKWRVPLLQAEASNPRVSKTYNVPEEKTGEKKNQPSSHFPIVVGDIVFVHDKDRIRSLRLKDGRPAWSIENDGAFFTNARGADTVITFSPFDTQPIRLGEPRFTLSAAGKTLVATMGSNGSAGGTGNPELIGFDLSTEGGVQFGPIEIADGNWSFHGAPICEGTRCWVGLRSRDTSAQDFVACFDTRSGKELWRSLVCSADTIGHNSAVEVSNYLLTKHEDTVYCSSHLGTVAAISADEGNIRWVTKYPRQSPKRRNLLDEPWHALRDLTPCLYHDGLLIVAPSDTNKILALHAGTGKLIWESEFGGDANQLLGVGENNHLIVSGRRLWWIDVYTGRLSRKAKVNPFPSGGLSEPNGAGRGVLSGGNIYWPTLEGEDIGKIYVLSQADGKARRQPIDLEEGKVKPGNLVVTPTHLLIAAWDELVAYRIDSK